MEIRESVDEREIVGDEDDNSNDDHLCTKAASSQSRQEAADVEVKQCVHGDSRQTRRKNRHSEFGIRCVKIEKQRTP